MTCGIYAIINDFNKKTYVGQSQNIEDRWNNHKSSLRNGAHINEKLQSEWDKFGEDPFKFIILEECHKYDLTAKESYWAYKFDVWNWG